MHDLALDYLDSMHEGDNGTGERFSFLLFDDVRRLVLMLKIERQQVLAAVASGRTKTATDIDERLDPKDLSLLVAMSNLGTVSSETRKTRARIATENDHLDTGETIAQRMASLVKQGLAYSKLGRGGGYWLTSKGKETVQM